MSATISGQQTPEAVEDHREPPTFETAPWALELFGGACFGSIVGFLLGFYVTEGIGSTLVGFAAVLAGILWSWRFGSIPPSRQSSGYQWMAIGFGFFCVLAVIVGIWARSHNWFGTPVSSQIEELIAAGYPPEEAREITSIRRFRVQFEPKEMPSPAPAARTSSQQRNSDCIKFAPSKFRSVGDRLTSLKDSGSQWGALASLVERLDTKRKTAILNAAYKLACPDTQ